MDDPHTSTGKIIAFDFDGVIADSFGACLDTVKVICPAITEADYRRRFEGNTNEVKFPETFHDDSCRHDLDWFDIYVPKLMKVRLFPGMKDLILKLSKEYVLVIISSTTTVPIEDFLAAHGIRECFDWIIGNDVHEGKAEKISMVFEKYGITKADCLFITDSLGDIREADETGMPSIGVTWGFCSPDTLKKGNPSALVDDPAALEAAITNAFTHSAKGV